jgi:hypothetical protein
MSLNLPKLKTTTSFLLINLKNAHITIIFLIHHCFGEDFTHI